MFFLVNGLPAVCGGLVCLVPLAHWRHSTDTLPTNDLSNLLTLSASHVPFTLASPATQTFSQSFSLTKHPLATGPLRLLTLLPGLSPLFFFLIDSFSSSWLKVTSLTALI